jgi:hypothetical protein
MILLPCNPRVTHAIHSINEILIYFSVDAFDDIFLLFIVKPAFTLAAAMLSPNLIL